jgi:hypothetical protein
LLTAQSTDTDTSIYCIYRVPKRCRQCVPT